MKYRVKFTKGAEVKYIGHLDVMRLFQRAVKRASLPIAYSKGFNPHQQMAFANPLSLGMTSTGEYGDFEMAGEVTPEAIVEGLNSVLPDGVKVLSASAMREGCKNAMASVEAASYEAVLDDRVTPEMIERFLPSFLDREEIKVMKKTKHNFLETDIREDIFEIRDISENGQARLYLFLAAGSSRNVKAELVLSCFYDFMGLPFEKYKIRYNRNDLFQLKDEKYIPLNEGIE